VDGPILLFRIRANVVKGCLDDSLAAAMVESSDEGQRIGSRALKTDPKFAK
jgi:hypothetical protein